jgi:hypothetical protein
LASRLASSAPAGSTRTSASATTARPSADVLLRPSGETGKVTPACSPLIGVPAITRQSWRAGYDPCDGARRTWRTTPVKYLMLIYGNQEKWASIPAEEWPEAIAKQDAFNRKYQATGELIGAYGLADEVQAKLVRREGGQPAVTDGPYLETKEYIASFYLLDCESEERALQIAADMPWADVDPVEFWPIMHEAKPDL